MAPESTNGANGHASYAEKHSIAAHFIGGNSLANAPASKVKDFVAQHDGHTVITNVSFCSADASCLGAASNAGSSRNPPGNPKLLTIARRF